MVFTQLLWQSVFLCLYVQRAVAVIVSSKCGKTRMVKLVVSVTVAGLSPTLISS